MRLGDAQAFAAAGTMQLPIHKPRVWEVLQLLLQLDAGWLRLVQLLMKLVKAQDLRCSGCLLRLAWCHLLKVLLHLNAVQLLLLLLQD